MAAVVSAGMSFLLARGGSAGIDGRLKQDGKVTVGGHGEREVFYAVPFAGPPNLELHGFDENAVIFKEQKADHFTLQNKGPFQQEVRWKADGIRK